MTSELLAIPGVGEKTAKKLLAHFGSLSKLRELTVEEQTFSLAGEKKRIIVGKGCTAKVAKQAETEEEEKPGMGKRPGKAAGGSK